MGAPFWSLPCAANWTVPPGVVVRDDLALAAAHRDGGVAGDRLARGRDGERARRAAGGELARGVDRAAVRRPGRAHGHGRAVLVLALRGELDRAARRRLRRI